MYTLPHEIPPEFTDMHVYDGLCPAEPDPGRRVARLIGVIIDTGRLITPLLAPGAAYSNSCSRG